MMLRMAIAVLGVWGSNMAATEEIRIDGCAELARIVYDEVQSSVLRGPGGAGPWYINPGQGDIHVCRTAAKTVSRAFGLALQSAGVNFSWSDSVSPGDHCMRGFLSQCYPNSRSVPGSEQQPDPVGPIWRKVSQAVMGEMYNPHSSDEVRFRADDLRLRLGLSLRNSSLEQGR
ncbi:MAG: hypothetical protein AAFN50_12695 [Pseudomonadota bacterium]